MDSNRDENGVAIPEETTRLLSDYSENERFMASNNSLDERPSFWQRNIVMLIFAYLLLQLYSSFFSGASFELKQRRICYEYYKEHNPTRLTPYGELDWFSCNFEEPVRREMNGLVAWERIFAAVPGKYLWWAPVLRMGSDN